LIRKQFKPSNHHPKIVSVRCTLLFFLRYWLLRLRCAAPIETHRTTIPSTHRTTKPSNLHICKFANHQIIKLSFPDKNHFSIFANIDIDLNKR